MPLARLLPRSGPGTATAQRELASGTGSEVIISTADRGGFLDALRGMGAARLTDVVPVVFLLLLIWLIVFGPGPVSVDALLRRWLGWGDAPEPEPTNA